MPRAIPASAITAGCQHVDTVEELAIQRAKELFGAEHVNVQPHSGSSANMAAYLSVLKPGDTILGMDLAQGGHLTHGSKVSFSGMLFKAFSYGVDRQTETIDYDAVQKLAEECRPRMLVVGASAYARVLDFPRFQQIAKAVGAYLMVDIAHIAGFVATGLHPSPVPYADFVTTTTHKTMRGPRAGIVMCKAEHAKAVDKIIFPGLQGGPLMHVIAAKAVALKEALSPSFKKYQQQVQANAKVLAQGLLDRGYKIVSGGTDTHLFLVNLTNKSITGKEADAALDAAGIIVNKNAVPYDEKPPAVASGIRIGAPIVSTRGMRGGRDERDRRAGRPRAAKPAECSRVGRGPRASQGAVQPLPYFPLLLAHTYKGGVATSEMSVLRRARRQGGRFAHGERGRSHSPPPRVSRLQAPLHHLRAS
jgi:glycine hydroxymethyltransferase